MATKFQQGGQDDQELFSAYLIKLFKPKSQQEFEDTISKLSEREINEMSCLLLIYLFIFSLLIFQI